MSILVGICIGMIASTLIFMIFLKSKKKSGTFIIDFTDPMKDVCRLELEEDINDLCKKKQIILKVISFGISQQ